MIKKLLFSLLIAISFVGFSQVQTVEIDWTFGSNSNVTPATASNNADRTIEVGDTVRWNYITSGNHNVSSKPGSQESFTSGALQGPGSVYEYTFTQVGVNDYQCDPHSGNMFGRITVVAEGTLSSQNFEKELNFYIRPNPSRNRLNIELSKFSSDVKVEVFDVLGKKIFNTALTSSKLDRDISDWKSGIYLVRLSSNTVTETKRFIKQ